MGINEDKITQFKVYVCTGLDCNVEHMDWCN